MGLLHIDERAMYMYRTPLAQMSLRCQLPASCALAWAVQQFSDCCTHTQLSSVYLLSTARVGHVISEPRLPPALAQFTSGGRREPGDEAIVYMHHTRPLSGASAYGAQLP